MHGWSGRMPRPSTRHKRLAKVLDVLLLQIRPGLVFAFLPELIPECCVPDSIPPARLWQLGPVLAVYGRSLFQNLQDARVDL